MASAADGPSFGVALLAINQQTGNWEIATSVDVNGKACVAVAVQAGGGGGGGGPTVSSTATETVVAASAASVTLLNANSNRVDATFYNNQAGGGASSLYLSFGSAASLVNFAVRVAPNALFTLPVDYTGSVFGVWDNGATGQVAVTEFTP